MINILILDFILGLVTLAVIPIIVISGDTLVEKIRGKNKKLNIFQMTIYLAILLLSITLMIMFVKYFIVNDNIRAGTIALISPIIGFSSSYLNESLTQFLK